MQIDFATIHDARAILRQLVECNPNPLREIDSTEWLDELTRSETPMAKTTTQRVIDYRERQKKIGIRGMFVYIKDTDRDSLEQIALMLNLTLGECVSYLLSEYQRNQTNG